jgi:hypothetical protein
MSAHPREWFEPVPKPEDVLRQVRPSIPLERALLCLDCDAVFEMGRGASCPACGSSTTWTLGRLLDRRAA